MYAQLYHRIKRIIAVRHNKTRKLNVYGVFEGSKPVYGNHVALQAGIEPASTVPETAILSIRLLERADKYYATVSPDLLSLKTLRRPTISVTVLDWLTDDGLNSMNGNAPVALI